jgi:hypothetical protein
LPVLPTSDALAARVAHPRFTDALGLCLRGLRHGSGHEHEYCLFIEVLEIALRAARGVPNQRPGVEAGGAIRLQIGGQWPSATQAGYSADKSSVAGEDVR